MEIKNVKTAATGGNEGKDEDEEENADQLSEVNRSEVAGAIINEVDGLNTLGEANQKSIEVDDVDGGDQVIID